MKEEKDSLYYDNVYKKSKHYSLNVTANNTIYRELYFFVKNLLSKEENILEIGCGTGQFAEMLIKENYKYILGIDFSSEAICVCNKRCKTNLFVCENIYSFNFDIINFETAFALEVFEHIEKDLEVLNKFPKDKRIIFSVPSYDDIAHVRFFKNKDEVINRFEFLFSEFEIYEIGKIFVVNAKKK